MSEYFYKIQRIGDGRFSMGGSYPSFNLAGKVWVSTAQLKSHLRMLASHPELYDNCRIVSYEMVISDKVPFLLEDIMEEFKQDKLVAKLANKQLTTY